MACGNLVLKIFLERGVSHFLDRAEIRCMRTAELYGTDSQNTFIHVELQNYAVRPVLGFKNLKM